MKLIAGLTLALLGLASLTTPAQPAPAPPKAVPDPDEVGQFFPALAAMPAPDWIKVGTRFTYLTAAGHDEGDGQLIPAKTGNIVERGTGRRFFHWPADERYEAGGGSAFTQVDVAALAGPVAVLDVGGYGFTPVTGELSLSNATGVATNSGFNTWWVNPAALRKLAETGGGDAFVVLAMPYAMDGKKYDVVRVQTIGRGGSYTAFTYDLASGVLLRRMIVADPNGVFTVDGGRFRGRRSLTASTLKNSRQLKLPWLDAPTPDWVGQVNAMTLKGSALYVTPGQGQNPATPMEARFAVSARGAGWWRFTSEFREMGAAGIPMEITVERASGSGSLGGLWVAPQALQGMKARQVIDEDPVTKVSTVVTWVGQAPDGRQAVGISQISPQTQIDNIYDAQSGMLKRTVLTWNTPTARNIRTVDVVGTR